MFDSQMQLRYRLLTHANITELDNEAVVLNLNTGQFYGLNDVGLETVRMLKDGAELEHLVNEIQKRFDHPADAIRKDLSVLLEQLVQAGLIGVE